MEHELNTLELATDAFTFLMLIVLCIFAIPLLKIIFFLTDKINVHIVQKLVQIYSSRDIIDMSQGGKGRNGRQIYKQRSSGRKRSH